VATLDDAVTAITADITTIGLSMSSVVGGEVTGGGYAPLAPTYAAATSSAADITAPLAFSGPAGTVVTHLIFRTAAGVLRVRALDAPRTFNSDGRLNVTSAQVTIAFGA
jgi:hypothetical protein